MRLVVLETISAMELDELWCLFGALVAVRTKMRILRDSNSGIPTRLDMISLVGDRFVALPSDHDINYYQILQAEKDSLNALESEARLFQSL